MCLRIGGIAFVHYRHLPARLLRSPTQIVRTRQKWRTFDKIYCKMLKIGPNFKSFLQNLEINHSITKINLNKFFNNYFSKQIISREVDRSRPKMSCMRMPSPTPRRSIPRTFLQMFNIHDPPRSNPILRAKTTSDLNSTHQ